MSETCDYIIDVCQEHSDDAQDEGCPYCEIAHMQRVIDRTAIQRLDLEVENNRLTAEVRFWNDAAHLIARWYAEDSDETHTQIIDRAGDRISEVRDSGRPAPSREFWIGKYPGNGGRWTVYDGMDPTPIHNTWVKVRETGERREHRATVDGRESSDV